MKPSIGRIVHYVQPDIYQRSGEHLAAVVTRVYPDGKLSLQVFAETCTYLVFNVTEDQAGLVNGTWHWPEREV